MRGNFNLGTKNVHFCQQGFEIFITWNNVEKIKDLLVQQIFSTVRWRETLIYISKAKVKNFIEIGPGKALTGMVKRTIKDVNSFSINSIADIKNLINELKK